MSYVFTDEDIRQLESEGRTVDEVEKQIEIFKRGVSPLKLNRPCTIDDGIMVVKEEEVDELVRLYEEEMRAGKALKFVPASGAATRMFRDWYRCLERGGFSSPRDVEEFFSHIEKFAFYDDLRDVARRRGSDLREYMCVSRVSELLEFILTPSGLNYGNLPKALLKFHTYPEGARTALEEHLVEASLYTRDRNDVCRVHFTLSEGHLSMVKNRIREVLDYYERKFGVAYEIAYSVQKSSTDTIAVDLENNPFRDPSGKLVFRPAGHGALLENLNGIDRDIIFIKNIDNVVPDRLKDITVKYKKILGGLLVRLQKTIFTFLHVLESKVIDENTCDEIFQFCRHSLNLVFPGNYETLPLSAKGRFLFEKLNRPLRVCGMVKNEGEPGGGPFWVDEDDGGQSLQIVEESQIDVNVPEQKTIWLSSTHFNPVDLVCGVRDFKGKKFNLLNYVDPKAYIITRKSEKGKELKALELPGLWNGAMAFWNTVFVEVPLLTFNPVKTVYDLLRPQHMP